MPSQYRAGNTCTCLRGPRLLPEASIQANSCGLGENAAELSPNLKWLKTSGLITKEKWGNLPGGEIFTSPKNTNGVFVVDGVVGDYLCERYGDLQECPLVIEVENNRIRSLRSENKDLRDDFRLYTSTDENSDRVGEFAIGTNTACTRIIGHILQDEKIPECTLPSVTLTRNTPAPIGFPRRTSTVSGAISASGLTTSR